MTRLDIGFKRTCSCPENYLSCITAKEWAKAQAAVWEFFYTKEDVRDALLHPATFPLQLAERCISLFTHEGELVLDPFVGSGTTLLAAKRLGRNAVGFDLKKDYCDLAEKRLSQLTLFGTKQIVVCDDARNIPHYLDERTVSLIVTSPPYANLLSFPYHQKSRRQVARKKELKGIIRCYSDDERDLGNLEPKRFVKELVGIFRSLLPLLRESAHCILVLPAQPQKRVPLSWSVAFELIKNGFSLENVIIWDRRKLLNQIGIFGWPARFLVFANSYEYLLDFKKR